MEILAFRVADRRHALLLADVREVLRAVSIAPLPGAPDVVEGLIDVRGALTPVMDLRARLGLPPKPVELSDQLILATAGERTVALRVDGVEWVREVDPLAVESARELAPGAEYIAGVARLPDGIVLIYDLPRFLSPREAEALAGALAARGTETRE